MRIDILVQLVSIGIIILESMPHLTDWSSLMEVAEEVDDAQSLEGFRRPIG
jgi:hypothetical protein